MGSIKINKKTSKPEHEIPRTFLEKLTTIHGTNQFQLKSGKSRALWWLAMATTFIGTLVFIVKVQEKLRSDQIYTKVDSTCQVNQVPFPCVSVCNLNMVSMKETANIAKLLKRHNRTEKEIGQFLEDLPKLKYNITPDAHNATEIMNILKGYYYTMDTIIEEVYQKCENLLLYCEFNRRVKNCNDVFTLIKTVEGHCCAFNYAALNDVSELSLLPHDDTLEYYDGDEESDHVSGTIIATSESGRSSGLTVVFNVEPEDYPSWSRAHNYGANIVINDPNDFPETSARDTFVTIGTAVDVKVEPRVYQSEPDVRRASPGRRACWFHDEVVLEHTDRYSYETCVTECIMYNFIQECGCIPYKYPRDDSRRFCELADLPCTYNLTVYGKRIPCDPPCYVECRDKRYDISKNTVPFQASDYPRHVTISHTLCENTNVYPESREVPTVKVEVITKVLVSWVNLNVFSGTTRFYLAKPVGLTVESLNVWTVALKTSTRVNATDFVYAENLFKSQISLDEFWKGHKVENLVALKVYFGKSSCSCYKLTLLMDVNYFIATYGGVLGLSFGASLLTVAELIYLIVATVCEKIARVKDNIKQKSKVNRVVFQNNYLNK